MAEAIITKKTIIIVNEVGINEYGGLTWTDKEGNSYKVKSTRKQYFEAIVPGQSVEISWSTYKGKEYPYSAEVVKSKLSPEPTSLSKATLVKTKGELVEHKGSPETGMWWKELGESIRSGDIDKSTLRGLSLRVAYYTEMSRVLGIPIKEVQSAKSSLVEEAKKLGANEVEPGEIPF